MTNTSSPWSLAHVGVQLMNEVSEVGGVLDDMISRPLL